MMILIADPRPEVQTALRLLLERSPAVTALREAGSLVQMLVECAQALPDLILFDLDLVPARGRAQALPELVIVLRRLCPAARIVVMSSCLEARQAALSAGASGFLSKTDPPDAVRESILRLLQNGSERV